MFISALKDRIQNKCWLNVVPASADAGATLNQHCGERKGAGYSYGHTAICSSIIRIVATMVGATAPNIVENHNVLLGGKR